MTLSDRLRYSSLRGAHDIHFNMSDHVVTQSNEAQPEQVMMFTPPSKEVMDKLGKDLVGHWESVPDTKWIGGCIPLKVDYKMNVYAPTGDEDVYLNESEADATCCFCIKMHRTTTGRSSSGGLSFDEIGQDEESLHQLSSRTVDHMRDDAGSHLVTCQVDGTDHDGLRVSRQGTFRFSNTGDATITFTATKPYAVKWELKKVSMVPKPLSDRFLQKKEQRAKVLQNSVQIMSDADIDAAVRFCDDVLSAPTLMLLPPTLEKRGVPWVGKHRTVTYPVARIETPDAPALVVKIEIPSKGVWDASVLTASGACVARSSLKAPTKFCKPPSQSALVEWGCKRFGVVGLGVSSQFESEQRCGTVPGQAIFAKGPTQDVVFFEDFNSKRNDWKVAGCKSIAFGCFYLGIPCAIYYGLQAEGEPYEALFKTFRGTEIGGFKIEKHRQCCVSGDDSLPKTEAVVHFGNMTAEQRRLALVAIMQGAALAAQPQEGGGGGGGGGP